MSHSKSIAIALTTFWSFVFTPRYGLLTNLLKAMGLSSIASFPWTAPETQRICWRLALSRLG